MKKPNETATYHFYNANPKGRKTTDCVVRAICTALQQDYNKTVMELAELQCTTGYDSCDSKLYDKYLQNKGWVKQKQPRKDNNTKYTGDEFCRKISKDVGFIGVNIIAHIGGNHIVCIKDINGAFKVHDTWDSTDRCIGNYWIK